MKSGSSDLIAKIRLYTKKHSELQKSHHFAFDVPLDRKVEAVDYVLMGINPGETRADWDSVAGPTEESREFDFHQEHGQGPASKRWFSMVRKMLDSSAVSLTEMFFWSTPTQLDLHRSFGKTADYPHFKFCAEINKALIERHKPKAVIFSGLSPMEVAVELYGLKIKGKPITNERGRLVVQAEGPNGTRWLFTKHFSGGRFAIGERDTLRGHILRLTR